MYSLYYSKASCSLAIHALLNELNQDVQLIERSSVADYKKISPTGVVPILEDNGKLIQEGAAIALYLMEKHKSPFLPEHFEQKSNAIQWMMFANATVHPAYSKMFFIGKNAADNEGKQALLKAAGDNVSSLWKIIDERLKKSPFVAGESLSMADIMLSVYANWNNFFPGLVELGENSKRMIKQVSQRPAFQKAIEAEKIKFSI